MHHNETTINMRLLAGSQADADATALLCSSGPNLTPQAPPTERIYNLIEYVALYLLDLTHKILIDETHMKRQEGLIPSLNVPAF